MQLSHYEFTLCNIFCLSICRECTCNTVLHYSEGHIPRVGDLVRVSCFSCEVIWLMMCMYVPFPGVQPVALNLSQSARGRVPVLPYVVPTALSAQSSASTVPVKQGIKHHLFSLDTLHYCCGILHL